MKLMKKTYLASSMVVLTLAFSACNQDKIKQLSSENGTLLSENKDLNTELEDYMKTFNEIETNLEEIKSRENMINVNATDDITKKETTKESIIKDVQAINALMEENKEKMVELASKLDSKSGEFKKMVRRLNKRIGEKDGEIASLKEGLETLNIEKEQLSQSVATLSNEVSVLNEENESQSELITKQSAELEAKIEALNTAYVAVGTYTKLKEDKVISKNGGVLGIGRVKTLNKNFNTEVFQKINIKEVTEISIDAQKAELVTNHPEGSYQLLTANNDIVEKLIITDPDKFWTSSKHLVVKVD